MRNLLLDSGLHRLHSGLGLGALDGLRGVHLHALILLCPEVIQSGPRSLQIGAYEGVLAG